MHTPVSHVRPEPMRRDGCTSDNWTEPPWNRWGFSHVRELARTARISRGNGPVWHLPQRFRDLGTLRIPHETGEFGLVAALEAVYTDAFVVVHDGELVYEWYGEGIRPDRNHLVMSVSKSFTSALIGALVGEGLIDTEERVETYVPELCGTAWEGATVQHCLDMAAGVQFDEDDYDNPESDGVRIEQVSGYLTHRRDDYPSDTASWILSLPPQGEHGDRFQYRSIITDVLGWIAESVTGMRFADAYADRIWSRIGAEHDADIIVDAKGFPTVEGGICVTARDLARFGLLHLQRGTVNGVQVLPAEWTDRVLVDDGTRRAHFAANRDGNSHEYYRDCWWVLDAARGLYAGHGINGQHVFVDRATNTVIAQQSTWPARLDLPLLEFGSGVVMAVLDELGR
jgi:6-aminohexanoate-oligomer exohydrolase